MRCFLVGDTGHTRNAECVASSLVTLKANNLHWNQNHFHQSVLFYAHADFIGVSETASASIGCFQCFNEIIFFFYGIIVLLQPAAYSVPLNTQYRDQNVSLCCESLDFGMLYYV
jgi:hypothetical protein